MTDQKSTLANETIAKEAKKPQNRIVLFIFLGLTIIGACILIPIFIVIYEILTFGNPEKIYSFKENETIIAYNVVEDNAEGDKVNQIYVLVSSKVPPTNLEYLTLYTFNYPETKVFTAKKATILDLKNFGIDKTEDISPVAVKTLGSDNNSSTEIEEDYTLKTDCSSNCYVEIKVRKANPTKKILFDKSERIIMSANGNQLIRSNKTSVLVLLVGKNLYMLMDYPYSF